MIMFMFLFLAQMFIPTFTLWVDDAPTTMLVCLNPKIPYLEGCHFASWPCDIIVVAKVEVPIANTLSTMVICLTSTNYWVHIILIKIYFLSNKIEIVWIKPYLKFVELFKVKNIIRPSMCHIGPPQSGQCWSLTFCLCQPTSYVLSPWNDTVCVHIDIATHVEEKVDVKIDRNGCLHYIL